jgi:O-antigen ligase/polysaccharide polymerase Wzy-like membrane protein
MMQDALLSLALLLSTASQLRLAGGALGPGEICLIIWLVLMLWREVARDGPPLTPVFSRLLSFWTLFIFAQAFGLLVGFAIEEIRDPETMLHDSIAYSLLAVVSCMSVVEPGAGVRLRRVSWLLALFGVPFLILQLANAHGLMSIPLIDPWYWDRFRGWSENPNQLALLCGVLTFSSVHLAETAARLWLKALALAAVAFFLYVGVLTHSDAFKIVMAVAWVILIAVKLRTWLISFERSTLKSATAWIVVIAMPLLAASAAPFVLSMAAHADVVAEGMHESGRDRDVRLRLWNEAISRGIGSEMLGLGPGAHLVSVPYKHEAPPNFEAHNTPLDLLTQGGLVAVLAFFWLAGTSFFVAYRARLAGLTALISAIGVFSMFHLVVRHPIFWFAIALCLTAAAEADRPTAALGES